MSQNYEFRTIEDALEERQVVRHILESKLKTLSKDQLVKLIMSIDDIEEILEDYLTCGDHDIPTHESLRPQLDPLSEALEIRRENIDD